MTAHVMRFTSNARGEREVSCTCGTWSRSMPRPIERAKTMHAKHAREATK